MGVEPFHPFEGLVKNVGLIKNIVEVDIAGHTHKIQIPEKFADIIRQTLKEKGSAWVQVKAKYDYRGFVRSYTLMIR